MLGPRHVVTLVVCCLVGGIVVAGGPGPSIPVTAPEPEADATPTVLITGATGFVGSAVVRKLLARGYRVRAMVRPFSDRRNIAGLELELVEGDMLEPESFGPALEGCSALFHIAADYRLWVPDPAALYAANLDGSRALIEAVYAAGDAAGCPMVDWHTQDFNATARQLYDRVANLTPFIKCQR